MKELDEIAHWVRTQAVPRLITGGEPPEPALPIRYDISVGHANFAAFESLRAEALAFNSTDES